jgi:hypothetical protein
VDLFGRRVYHRKQSRTQTPDVARMQEESGEIWGTYNRDAMGGRSSHASVDAYHGPLPSGQRGIEFGTDVPPDHYSPPHLARWTGPRDGVTIEGDYAKIRVTMRRNTQKD